MSKLFGLLDDIYNGENLYKVSSPTNLVGKYLKSPTHLCSLVENQHHAGKHASVMYVYFVDEDMTIQGEIKFDTHGVEDPYTLIDKVQFISGLVSDSADGEYTAVPVTYGNHFENWNLEDWVVNTFNAAQALDIIRIKDGRWTSAMCSGNGCCDPEGTAIPPLSKYESDDEPTSIDVNPDELLALLNGALAKLSLNTITDKE